MATLQAVHSSRAPKGGGGLVWLIFFGLMVGVGYALIAPTLHATQPRKGELGAYASREQIWAGLESALASGYGANGCKVRTALCLLAVIADPASPDFGRASPQVKVACCKDKFCAVAYIGLRDPTRPVLITAQYMDEARFERNCTRDKCVTTDLGVARGYLDNLAH